MEINFNLFRRSVIFAIAYFGLIITLIVITIVPSMFFQSEIIESITLTISFYLFPILYIGLLFKILDTWKRREANETEIWYQRWSTGHLMILFVSLLLFKISLVLGHGMYQLSFRDPYLTGSSIPIPYYVIKIFMFAFPAVTVVLWFMWFDIFQKPRRVQLGVIVAYMVFQGFIRLFDSLFSLSPTTIPEFSDLPMYGTVLVEFEKYQVILNDNIHYLVYSSMKFAFIYAIVVWLAYTLWTRYRNNRNDTSGLAVGDRS